MPLHTINTGPRPLLATHQSHPPPPTILSIPTFHNSTIRSFNQIEPSLKHAASVLDCFFSIWVSFVLSVVILYRRKNKWLSGRLQPGSLRLSITGSTAKPSQRKALCRKCTPSPPKTISMC
jgi:hypothetical protein